MKENRGNGKGRCNQYRGSVSVKSGYNDLVLTIFYKSEELENFNEHVERGEYSTGLKIIDSAWSKVPVKLSHDIKANKVKSEVQKSIKKYQTENVTDEVLAPSL